MTKMTLKKAYLFFMVTTAPVLIFLAGVWFGVHHVRVIDKANPWIVAYYGAGDRADAWGTPSSVEMVASNIALYVPSPAHTNKPLDDDARDTARWIEFCDSHSNGIPTMTPEQIASFRRSLLDHKNLPK